MRLSRVPPELMMQHLNMFTGALQLMADRCNGRYTLDDYIDHINKTLMQLWVAIDDDNNIWATAVSQIVQYPQRKAIQTVGCVGKNWREWYDLRLGIEEWGKTQGCDLAQGIAPRKWAPTFGDYKETHVLYEKDI